VRQLSGIGEIPTPAADAISEADVVVEVNTSGSTKLCGGWYPDDSLLTLLRRHGVRLTFGSDAHDPHWVGNQYDEVRARLREWGYRHWYVFERRNPQLVQLWP
jgi:histidinol-phosphatase (PHP family)